MTIKTAHKKSTINKVSKNNQVTSAVKVAGKRGRPKKNSAEITKTLVYADNEHSFWVTNGQILNSLISLRDALENMEKEVYHYHAGEAHNDFADWVNNVLCDTQCASELKEAKTPSKAKTVVIKHLKTYAV